MKEPKNILIIHCDELRADCLGYAGNPDVRTPNIDALAAESVNYTEHYTVYPICTPSRYSFWTGMYVHQHCAWNNGASLPTGFATMPGILRDNGFDTAVVGKMHFTPTYQDIGFSRMRLAEHITSDRYDDDYHYELAKQGKLNRIEMHYMSKAFRFEVPNRFPRMIQCVASDLPQELHTTGWTTEGALEEIRNWDEGRHLLMVGYIKPHQPFDPPHPYDTMYDPEKLTLPDNYTDFPLERDMETRPAAIDYEKLTEADIRQAMAYYYGNISHIDDGVGRMVALLKEKGLYEDTMIVFTSDHGDYMGQHHMILKCNHMYDALERIPLLIRYPGEKAGCDSRMSENIDVMPTILDVCGYEKPASVQGTSLLSAARKNYVFAEGQYGTDRNPCVGYMIRTATHKLLLRGGLNEGMLFDLQKDPAELENRFDDPEYAGVRAELMGDLIDTMLFSGAGKLHSDPAAPQVISPEELNEHKKFTYQVTKSLWEQEYGAKS